MAWLTKKPELNFIEFPVLSYFLQDWANEPLPATLHSEQQTRQKTSFSIQPRTKMGGFGSISRYQRSPSPPQRGRRKRNSGKDSDGKSGGGGKKARGSSPDFGGNPNCVPLGPSKRGGASSPLKFGGRGAARAARGGAGGLLTSKNRKGKGQGGSQIQILGNFGKQRIVLATVHGLCLCDHSVM